MISEIPAESFPSPESVSRMVVMEASHRSPGTAERVTTMNQSAIFNAAVKAIARTTAALPGSGLWRRSPIAGRGGCPASGT